MADISINGTVFSGVPPSTGTPWKPTGFDMDLPKIGRLLQGKDGTLTWMHRANKHVFKIAWEKTSTGTLNAVRAIRLLNASFTLINQFGASFTVLNSGEDSYTETFAFTDASGANYYNLDLTLREQ